MVTGRLLSSCQRWRNASICIRYLRCLQVGVEGGLHHRITFNTTSISIYHDDEADLLPSWALPAIVLIMSASSRSRSTSGVPVPKASSRTTRATSKLLADQQQKIAFPVGPLSPSIRDPSRSKVLPAQYSERSAAGPSERPKDVQGEEEEEEVLRDSVEAAP